MAIWSASCWLVAVPRGIVFGRVIVALMALLELKDDSSVELRAIGEVLDTGNL